MKIFEGTYAGEGIIDAGQNIDEAFMECYNPKIGEVPTDEHGIHKGSFKVTIEWIPEEE